MIDPTNVHARLRLVELAAGAPSKKVKVSDVKKPKKKAKDYSPDSQARNANEDIVDDEHAPSKKAVKKAKIDNDIKQIIEQERNFVNRSRDAEKLEAKREALRRVGRGSEAEALAPELRIAQSAAHIHRDNSQKLHNKLGRRFERLKNDGRKDKVTEMHGQLSEAYHGLQKWAQGEHKRTGSLAMSKAHQDFHERMRLHQLSSIRP